MRCDGMDRLQNLVRTVRTPEFDGITLHEVLAKSALNGVLAAARVPFNCWGRERAGRRSERPAARSAALDLSRSSLDIPKGDGPFAKAF